LTYRFFLCILSSDAASIPLINFSPVNLKGSKMIPQLTNHAEYRAAQANLDKEKLKIVLRFGRIINRGHAMFYFLGKRDLPLEIRFDDFFNKLIGTTLVMDPAGQTIITVYRNKKAMKNIKRK